MIKKQLLILLILLSSLAGYSQTVTPQWKALSGGISNYYPGKTPNGFDSLMYVGFLRTVFKNKADTINNDGYLTHGYFNKYGLKWTDTTSKISTQYFATHSATNFYGNKNLYGGLDLYNGSVLAHSDAALVGVQSVSDPTIYAVIVKDGLEIHHGPSYYTKYGFNGILAGPYPGLAHTFTWPDTSGQFALKSDIPGGGGGTIVNSFNGRTGSINPQSGDYSAFYGSLTQQNTNTGNISTNSTNLSNEVTRAIAAEASKQDTVTSEIWLSTKGILSDADISTGSRSLGTDQTVAIQALLNRASTGKSLKLHWDVKVGVKSLTVYGNTEIITTPGFGAILRDSTNAPMFRNAHKAASGTIIDSNIVFHGGIWNFNRVYQLHDIPTEGFINGFKFVGVKNLTLDNGIQLLNARCFSLLSSNFNNVHVDNAIVDVGSNSAINADGLHFNGTGTNLFISNSIIRSYDDGIAINADDVLSSYETGGFVPGPITNVYIKNIVFNNSLFGIRGLSGTSRIDNVNIDGLFGVTKGYGVIFDNYWQLHNTVTTAGNGNFGTMNIANNNINVTAKGVAFNIKQSYMNFIGKFDAINISNTNRRYFSYDAPIFRADSAYTTIGSLSLSNISSIDTSGVNTAALVSVNSGATIDKLSLHNIYSTKTTDLDAPVVLIVGGVVNYLKMVDVNTNHILSQVKVTSGTLSNAQASGITHINITPASGWINTSVTVPLVQVKGYIGSRISSGSGTITNNTYDDGSVYGYVNQDRHTIGDWSNGRNEFAGSFNFYKYLPTTDDGSNQTFANENILVKEGSFNQSRGGGMLSVYYNNGSGTITNAHGFLGGISNIGTGTITTAASLQALSPTASLTSPITTIYGLRVQAQKVTGVTTGYGISQDGTTDINVFNGSDNAFAGAVRIANAGYATGTWSVGTATPIGQFTSNNPTALTTGLNDFTSLSSIGGATGSGNTIRNRLYAVRNTASGTDWTTTTLYDGIDISGSFATPTTNLKTYFARNPNAATFDWGNAGTSYLSLSSTALTAKTPVIVTSATTTQATFTNSGAGGLSAYFVNTNTGSGFGAGYFLINNASSSSSPAFGINLADKSVLLPQFTTAGIVHNDVTTGKLTSSLIATADLGASLSLTTPNINVATATSINKVTITAPATSATLTIANGKTLTANNSITLAGTDATTMTFPSTSASIARTDAANTFTGVQSFTSNPVLNTTSIIGQIWTATNTAGAGNWATTPVLIDNILSKTADYTIVSGDFVAGKKATLDLYIDATAGNVTITLPSASTFAGYTIYVTKTDASVNIVTVNTVLGSNTLITQYQERQFNSNGTNWYNH